MIQNNFWNERYNTSEYIFGTEPNEFLAQQIKNLKTGRALFPCDGEGRNSVYAAMLGWDVFAFDLSSIGKNKALKLADNKGVSIHFEVEDAMIFDNGKKYDFIGLFYAHFPPEIRKQIHRRFASMLSNDGILVLEAFNPRQLPLNSGGPKVPEMLYSEKSLLDDFAGFNIIMCKEEKNNLTEGPGHKGIAEVIRLVVSKIKEQ